MQLLTFAWAAVKAIYKDEPDARIIVMGDLNDDPVDESLMKHLKIRPNRKNVSQGDLFDPMWQLFRDGIGSLAYRIAGTFFDQIIVSSAPDG